MSEHKEAARAALNDHEQTNQTVALVEAILYVGEQIEEQNKLAANVVGANAEY